mgnify:CR=1 FL=1
MIIASKIKLQRNFKDFFFPQMLEYEDSKQSRNCTLVAIKVEE